MPARRMIVMPLLGVCCVVGLGGLSACSDDEADTSPSPTTVSPAGEPVAPNATARADGGVLAGEADIDIEAILVASGLDADDAACVADALVERFGDLSELDSSSQAVQEAIAEIGGDCAGL
jgi:hypothetical protein